MRLLVAPGLAVELLGWGAPGLRQARAAVATAVRRLGVPSAADETIEELPHGGLRAVPRHGPGRRPGEIADRLTDRPPDR